MTLFSNGSEIVSRKVVQVDLGGGIKERFDIAKEPSRAHLAGYYHVMLTGMGSNPDVGTLVFNPVANVYDGVRVPYETPSRIISFRTFYTKMADSGIVMNEVYQAAREDVAVEQLLDLARNGKGGASIDLDDPMTIGGLNDLVGYASVPSCTQARIDQVLA